MKARIIFLACSSTPKGALGINWFFLENTEAAHYHKHQSIHTSSITAQGMSF